MVFFSGGIQCPSLWVGTSLGTVGLIALSLPTLEQRKSQAVLSNITGKYCLMMYTVLCSLEKQQNWIPKWWNIL